MSYTKGPWVISDANRSRILARFEHGSGNDDYWADVAVVEQEVKGGPANAYLIAAAPELLEVCKRAKWLYDQLSLGPLDAAAKYGPDYIPPGEDELLEIREDIGAVIAKAEGL